jgi:GT2 family glycosyltransferase
VTEPPLVNVVIATYQRPRPLERTLRALARQSFRSFVVTVVDDASLEPTADNIAPDLMQEPWLQLLRQPANGGPARARNVGVQSCATQLVAFVDDDVVPEPGWLQSMVDYALSGGPGTVVFGPLLAPPAWKLTPWNQWEADTLAKQYSRIAAGQYAPTWRQFFTGNALLWRDDFGAPGGFDESFTRAEDIELAYRLHLQGCQFRFASEAVGWHYAERSKEAWLALPRNYACFDREMHRLYPEMNWLGILGRERSRRSLLLRIARRFIHGRSRSALIRLAVEASRPVHALGVSRLSTRLLSLAYDLAYDEEIASQRPLPASARPGQPPRSSTEQPVNSESTSAR